MQKIFKSELGRSMVEMLGVLALVGVLSLAAIAGYSYAVTKWKANETLSEIGQRAMEESLFLMKPSTNPVLGMALPETDFGPTSSLGYAVQAFVSDVNADYFEIVLQNVPGAVCQQLIRDDEISIGVFVDETLASGEPSLCGEEETTPEMSFVFRADLSRFDNCSKKGYFDLTDLSCHCSGNTYIDSETNECLCPAGHIWSEDEKTCIESLCPENQYETVTNGCVPCSDQTPYKVSGAGATLCVSVCGEDNKMFYNGLCVDKNRCTLGKEITDWWGNCQPCTKTSGLYVPHNDFAEAECKACKQTTGKDHHMTSFGVCVQTDACTKGKNVRYFTTSGTDGGCGSCASTNDLMIGRNGVVGPVEKEYCEACVNSAGQKNRKVEGIYCVKVVCDEGEFKGSDGKCYSCANESAVAVGENSGCEAETCGRTIQDGKCLRDCPNGTRILTDDKACYDCSRKSGFSLGKNPSAAAIASCTACTDYKHHVSLTTGGNYYCLYDDQCAGNIYYSGVTTYCFSCSSKSNYGMGLGDFEREKCLKCDDRYIPKEGVCSHKKTCTRTTQFANNGGVCYACDYVSEITIGSHEFSHELCLACDPDKRFIAADKCYRCDSAATPGVTTEEERASCTRCDSRKISADGKCVLMQ